MIGLIIGLHFAGISPVDAAEDDLPPIFKVGNTVEVADGFATGTLKISEIRNGWVNGDLTTKDSFGNPETDTNVWLPVEAWQYWKEVTEP